MRCLRCGGEYQMRRGTLVLRDKFIGDYEVHAVEYFKCEQCGRLLFPEQTARKIEQRKEEVKKQLISHRPIREFITASEAADILGISRQALHKHRRIRRGFIYSIELGGRILYNLKSVLKFRECGDGRFPLIRQSDEEQDDTYALITEGSEQVLPEYKIQRTGPAVF